MYNKNKIINNILLYGGKSTSLVIADMIQDNKYKLKYIFDPFLKKIEFETRAVFSNKKKDLVKFLKNSEYFSVGIAREHGLARVKISRKLESYGLKPLTLLSKSAEIDKTSKFGAGLLAMPGSIVHKRAKIGNYCILNSNSCVDHECIIGDGVHIMGAAYIAGRVIISDGATIGANATILPDLKIGKNSIIGAGSVVTKDIRDNEIFIGNPAKFFKKHKPQYSISIFKDI